MLPAKCCFFGNKLIETLRVSDYSISYLAVKSGLTGGELLEALP